jgi:hypothetical protein
MPHSILQFLRFILITLITIGNPQVLQGKSLNENIRETYTPNVNYVPPSKDDLEKAKKLFYNLFSSSDLKIDITAWDSLGFEIERIEPFLIIKEKQSDQTGKGVYIFNTSKPSQVIIEIPHRPSDLHTATIAIKLMEEEPFLAAALNTVHRKKANFTAEVMTYFNAFTEAFGKVHPQGNIIQLHGFDGKSHEELHGTIPDLILSAGTESPPPLLYQYGDCLRKLPLKVLLFPRDIKILGATKNINAKNFRHSGSKGLFLHLEMSTTLRKKLRNNKDFRKTFFKCFLKTGR